MSKAITGINIIKEYGGRKVLDGIDLDIDRG